MGKNVNTGDDCGDIIIHNNSSLIIPKTERRSLLNQLHQYHTGADKAYNLANNFGTGQQGKQKYTK